MVVGIDFSIKSTAVTLIDNDGSHHFYTFARKSVAKEDFFVTLKNAGVNVIMLDDEPPLPKTANLTDRERSSIKDALMQTQAIAKMLAAWSFTENDSIAIEGFSFGSTGNRLAQISGYQWLLRSLIIQQCGISPDRLWFFSPMTIKATAGKGNFKKEQMIEAFINAEVDHAFHTEFVNNPLYFQNKKGAWLKPCDDLCDSYWIVKTMQKTLLT
jgi:hypothetical protein